MLQKSSEAVQASAHTNKDAVVAGLGGMLGPEVGEAAGLIMDKSVSRLADETAAKVSPSTRRSGQTAEVVETPDEGTDTPLPATDSAV